MALCFLSVGTETAVHFRYCFPVLAGASTKNLQRLQKLQNRTARIVTDSPYGVHLGPLTKELGWLTIKQLIDTETVKIIYKALYNKAPKHLKELFHRLSDVHNRELRNSKTDFHIPLLWTTSGQKNLSYSGVCIWNNLTNNTK